MKIELDELSIVVVAKSNNPTILNPDFLQHNGIVDKGWPLNEDPAPLTSSVMSQVSFKGGLVVRATPANVSFTLSAREGESTAFDGTPCVDSAKGYLKTVPHVPYIALGVNLKATDRNSPLNRVSNGLRSEGDWLAFQSIMPQLELKATYEYADKRTTLEVVDQSECTMYRVNIHRDVKESNQQMRVSTLLAMLDAWQSDLDHFLSLVDNSLPRTTE